MRRCFLRSNLPPPPSSLAFPTPSPPKQKGQRQHEPTRTNLVARASYLGISDLTATMLRGAVVAAALLLAAAAVGEVPGAEGFHLGGDESGLVRGVLAALSEKAVLRNVLGHVSVVCSVKYTFRIC
jgi:hypothetical protein